MSARVPWGTSVFFFTPGLFWVSNRTMPQLLWESKRGEPRAVSWRGVAMQPLLSHEVIGTRVGHMPVHELIDIWAAASSGVVKYGFAIEYRDLEPPRTGIFDGLRIVIDPDVGFEMQCFLLLHLFGHSVQWVAPSIEHKLVGRQHTEGKAVFMTVLQGYEMEAAQLALQLLHERGTTTYDRWFADFVHTDWRYVERYYEQDRLPPWDECVVSGGELIAPR